MNVKGFARRRWVGIVLFALLAATGYWIYSHRDTINTATGASEQARRQSAADAGNLFEAGLFTTTAPYASSVGYTPRTDLIIDGLAYQLDAISDPAVTGITDFIVDHDGTVYAGTSEGTVVKIRGYKPQVLAVTGGRVAALAFDPLGNLVVADEKSGLFQVTRDGKVTILQLYAGVKPARTVRGVAVAYDGMIYFSDNLASADPKGSSSGRLLAYDPDRRSARVLLDNIAGAGPVALAYEDAFAIVAAATPPQLLRYWLTENPGATDVFQQDLSGPAHDIFRDENGDIIVTIPALKPAAAESDASDAHESEYEDVGGGWVRPKHEPTRSLSEIADDLQKRHDAIESKTTGIVTYALPDKKPEYKRYGLLRSNRYALGTVSSVHYAYDRNRIYLANLDPGVISAANLRTGLANPWTYQRPLDYQCGLLAATAPTAHHDPSRVTLSAPDRGGNDIGVHSFATQTPGVDIYHPDPDRLVHEPTTGDHLSFANLEKNPYSDARFYLFDAGAMTPARQVGFWLDVSYSGSTDIEHRDHWIEKRYDVTTMERWHLLEPVSGDPGKSEAHGGFVLEADFWLKSAKEPEILPDRKLTTLDAFDQRLYFLKREDGKQIVVSRRPLAEALTPASSYVAALPVCGRTLLSIAYVADDNGCSHREIHDVTGAPRLLANTDICVTVPAP